MAEDCEFPEKVHKNIVSRTVISVGYSCKQKRLLLLALTAGVGLGAAEDAEAQGAVTTGAQSTDDQSIALPALRVHGKEQVNTLNTNTTQLDIGRMPASVRETPQTISVVPKALIEEQRIFTLDQALSNVPDITTLFIVPLLGTSFLS